ncbi:MAG: hypothetical protein J6Y39_05075 [Bacteroidaceae bacterium]|nr:hypothetical protein [Bacteroidaceae bacterium]
MRNKLLSFLGMVLLTISANASVEGWNDPSYTTTQDFGEDGYSAILHLVGKDVFLTAGGTWGSHAAMTPDLSKAFLYAFYLQANGGYNLVSDQAAATQKLGRQSEKDLYTDYNNQNGWGLYYTLTQLQNGNWQISTFEDDPYYGSALYADWEDMPEDSPEEIEAKEAQHLKYLQAQYVLGWDPTNEDSFQGSATEVMYEDDGVTPKNVNILMLDPTRDDIYAEWDFVDELSYLAYVYQGKIIALIEEIIAEGLEAYGANYEDYHDAYDSGDIDQIVEAYDELAAVVSEAKQAKAFSEASETNPQDATFMLENPAFDAGNISGWTCTFVSGQNANNVGYQQGGNGYINGDIKVWKFIEAWANQAFNPNVTYRTIGDGKLSQTIVNMPQGKYKFTCDCIAVQQDGASDPVTGVELFAIGGTLDVFTNLSTGNGVPEHFELTFVNTGGDVEIGLRTNNATANWIAADNFTLTYYGPVTDDPQKVILDGAISTYESTYPDLTEVYAYSETKTAFSEALADAKAVSADDESTSDDYTAAKEALDAAATALTSSVNEYTSFKAYIDGTLTAKIADVSEFGWATLANTLADYKTSLNRAYNEGTYSSEDIAGVSAQVTTLIGEYISTNCKEGDDITILIENAGFSAAQTWNGWTKTNYDGTGNISAGNHRWGGQNVKYPAGFVLEGNETVTEEFTADDGCVEIWRGAFKYSQTISQMPAGLYTLSCKGFWRNEDNQADVTAAANAPELFAIYDKDGVEQVQTQKFTNIFRDCTDAMLYNGGSANGTMAYGGGTGQEQDKNEAAPANGKYYPNGMCGASAHFAAGGYKQEFNFVLTTVTDVTIGARSQGANYWTLFDDFQLVYQGNGAAAYYGIIQNLMEEAANIRDNSDATYVESAYDELQAAYQAGSDALSGGTSEDCMAAVAQLQAAIANGEAAAVKVQEMNAFIEELTDELMTLVSSSDTDLQDKIDEVTSARDNFEIADLAAIDQYIEELKAGFTNYVMVDIVDAADEDNPQDASFVIMNPDYDNVNADKWTTADSPAFGNGAAEFYNKTFRLSQTIYGLPAGWYVLGVKGYYRFGNPGRVQNEIDAVTSLDDMKKVTLFAGATSTPFLLIQDPENMPAFSAYNAGTEDGTSLLTVNKGQPDEENFRVPNNMEKGAAAFDNDIYQNYLLFQVENDGDNVEIGIEKTEAIAEDWTMFDTWTLDYLGTAQPTDDPTTAIQSIETAPVAANAAIYNLAGQRVSKAVKGIYIINGKKVVIK